MRIVAEPVRTRRFEHSRKTGFEFDIGFTLTDGQNPASKFSNIVKNRHFKCISFLGNQTDHQSILIHHGNWSMSKFHEMKWFADSLAHLFQFQTDLTSQSIMRTTPQKKHLMYVLCISKITGSRFILLNQIIPRIDQANYVFTKGLFSFNR